MKGSLIIYTPSQLEHLAELLKEGPLKIEFKSFNRRSNPQNAIFHLWCSEIAQHFIKGGKSEFSNGDAMNMENVKEHLKHTFLGSQPVQKVNLKTGEIEIHHETRSSASLTKGEMVHFLDSIREWAIQFDIRLTIPVDTEYHQYLVEQGELAA